MVTVYLIPPGDGLDHCITNFKSVLQEYPFKTRLIVPTERLASNIRNQLSGEFAAIRKDAVTTPSNFAEDIIQKNSPHVQIISDVVARQILTDIVRKNSEGLSITENISGRVFDLATLFNELKSYQAENHFFEKAQNPKTLELFKIYRLYRNFLSEHNLLDRASLYGSASETLEKEDLHIFVYGIRSPYQNLEAFLNKLGKTAVSFIYYHPFDENNKIYTDRAEWLGAENTISLTPRDGLISFSRLFSVTECKQIPEVTVLTHEFRSRNKEVEAVAEEIVSLLENGYKFEDIMIGSPDLTTTTTLIHEIFPEFGLPFTSSTTISLSRSPIIQALFHLLEIPTTNYKREDVIAALASPYIRWLPEYSRITPAIIDKVVRDALIIDGYHSWATAISHLETRTKHSIDSPDTPDYRRAEARKDLEQIHEVTRYVLPFLQQLRALEQKTNRGQHTANIRDFLSHLDFVPTRASVQDGEDIKGLFSILDELEVHSANFPGSDQSYQDFIKSLKAEIRENKTTTFKTGKGIQVVGLRELHDQTIPILFLLDLTDVNLPHIPGLLPFLSDYEEKLVNPEMKPMNLRDERFYFIAALCTATKKIYATTSSTPDQGGLIPSPFFRELRQKIPCEEWSPLPPENSLRYRQEYTGTCLSEQRLPHPLTLPGIGECSHVDELVNKINAEYFHRNGIYDSPFDCVLCLESEICQSLAKRFGDNRAYSVSSLEKYADCPFSFYMQYVLGLKATPDVEITLTPADRGSLVHQILSKFYTQWMTERKLPPGPNDRGQAMALVTRITESEVADFGKDGPAWDAFKSDLLGTGGYHRGILERFLDIEMDRAESPFVPTFFECSFGFSGIGNSISLDPAILPVKGQECAGIKIHGFIDRVDISAEGEFTITDYKTGNHASLSEVREGKSLQLPLYIRSVEILTERKGVAGAYYKLHRKEVYHKAELHRPNHPSVDDTFTKKSRMNDADLDELINNSILSAWTSIQAIRSGLFHPPTTSCASSEYCDFKRICRYSELRALAMEEPEGGVD